MKYIISILLLSLVSFNSFAETKSFGDWHYSERIDDMTGEKIAKTIVESNDRDIGMIFICKNNGLNTLGIILDEVFSAPGAGVGLLFKVDEHETLKFNGVMNSYKAIGLAKGFNELVKQMKQGSQLKVRAITHDHKIVNFNISLNGFKEAYEKVQNYCK